LVSSRKFPPLAAFDPRIVHLEIFPSQFSCGTLVVLAKGETLGLWGCSRLPTPRIWTQLWPQHARAQFSGCQRFAKAHAPNFRIQNLPASLGPVNKFLGPGFLALGC